MINPHMAHLLYTHRTSEAHSRYPVGKTPSKISRLNQSYARLHFLRLLSFSANQSSPGKPVFSQVLKLEPDGGALIPGTYPAAHQRGLPGKNLPYSPEIQFV